MSGRDADAPGSSIHDQARTSVESSTPELDLALLRWHRLLQHLVVQLLPVLSITALS